MRCDVISWLSIHNNSTKVRGTVTGHKLYTSRNIFTTVIIPKLCYGANLWDTEHIINIYDMIEDHQKRHSWQWWRSPITHPPGYDRPPGSQILTTVYIYSEKVYNLEQVVLTTGVVDNWVSQSTSCLLSILDAHINVLVTRNSKLSLYPSHNSLNLTESLYSCRFISLLDRIDNSLYVERERGHIEVT